MTIALSHYHTTVLHRYTTTNSLFLVLRPSASITAFNQIKPIIFAASLFQVQLPAGPFISPPMFKRHTVI